MKEQAIKDKLKKSTTLGILVVWFMILGVNYTLYFYTGEEPSTLTRVLETFGYLCMLYVGGNKLKDTFSKK